MKDCNLRPHPHGDVHLRPHLCCLLQLSARVLAVVEHGAARRSSSTWNVCGRVLWSSDMSRWSMVVFICAHGGIRGGVHLRARIVDHGGVYLRQRLVDHGCVHLRQSLVAHDGVHWRSCLVGHGCVCTGRRLQPHLCGLPQLSAQDIDLASALCCIVGRIHAAFFS
jgi:hypothetical protein